MISIFSNSLGAEEHKVLADLFESKWIGLGKECTRFEEEFAAHLQVPSGNVLLYNSCTASIYGGLQALGIGAGDEVIISTINFVACANAVLELGAQPVFADVNPRTLNILPEEITRLKTPKTKAVIVLHYGGHPAPMQEILAACGPDIMLFEDSANAIASTYKGQPCGTFGQGSVWSFDAMKILSMGDGGALYLSDQDALDKAKSRRFLGLTNNTVSGKDAMENNKERWWEYELDTASGRFVSNDIAASIGRIQLRKLDDFIQRRKALWEYYQQALAGIEGLTLPPELPEDCTGSYYFYWIQLEEGRDALARHLVDHDIYATFRYFPLHLVTFYNAGISLKNAEWVNETTLNIPLHQNVSQEDAERIVSLIRAFFAARRPL